MHTCKNPDMDDYKKLSCVIQYLRGTQELTLMIEPGEHPSCWVASLYSVHPEMHSHRGICMMLGKGVAYSGSIKY